MDVKSRFLQGKPMETQPAFTYSKSTKEKSRTVCEICSKLRVKTPGRRH